MTPDYSLLLTWADCDAAAAAVAHELKTLNYRDTGFELADERATLGQTAAATALAKKDGEITVAQGQAGVAGLSPQQHQDALDAVELLQAQRKQLLKRTRTATGPDRFATSVDAVQIQVQADALTTILAGIAAHRATLPG